jgi:hypothetical protein
MLRRVGFKSKLPERQPRLRDREPAPLGALKPLRAGIYAGTTAAAAPKTEPKRNQALLDMARGRHCLLSVPGICTHDTATTVAAHSNLSIHGKAAARKADDCYSVQSCMACHRWLDQGPAPADVKELAFTLAHLDQVVEWRRIAADVGEPRRFRTAAQWALDQLNATPRSESCA